jgi:hypothetical protein
LVLPEFGDGLNQFFGYVFAYFLKEFSAFGTDASALWASGLDEPSGFQLVEDLSNVASACFACVVGSDAEAFSSAVVAAESFQADWAVDVDFAQEACAAGVPPVWVLGLFFGMAACFGECCPCWGLDLLDVFFQVGG